MAESRINVPVKFRTESEESIANSLVTAINAEVTVEGTITLSETNLYLGLGNGEYYKYDGTDTEGMPIVAQNITDEEEAKVLTKERQKPVLYFNSGIPSITQIEANGDITSVNLFGEAITQEELDKAINDLRNALQLKIDLKPSIDEVFTKAEGAQLLERASKIEQRITDEETRATTREDEIEKKIDSKAKVIFYNTGTKVTPPDFIVHGNTIYLVTKEFTTSGNFTTDSVNLQKAAPDIILNIGSYKAGDAYEVGDMIIYQGKLYTCETAVANATDWNTDSASFDNGTIIFNIDDYYVKADIDEFLKKKQDSLTPSSGVKIDKTDNTITVSADMTTTATADKIVQRDSAGVAYANNNAQLSDTELINNKTLATTKQDLIQKINEIEDKFIGTAEESFSLDNQILTAPEKMGTQTIACKVININPNDVTFACQVENWNQLVKLTLETANDTKGTGTITVQWLNNPSDTGWIEKFQSTEIEGTIYKVLKVTASKGGNVLADLYFNAPNATPLKNSTADYNGSRYKVYTVVINMALAKTNPTPTFAQEANTEPLPFSDYTSWKRTDGCCYYEDDAVGKNYKEVMEFLGITPVCLSNGQIVEYLNPDDYSLQKDGSASSYKTLGRDVMVMFPKRGLRFKWEGSLLKISITDQENAEGYTYDHCKRGNVFKDRFYYGAYMGYVDSNMLYSSSGRSPRVNTTLTQFRVYARARNNAANGVTGYQLPSWHMIKYIQACYLLVHKSLNGQATVGYGRSSGGSVCVTGGSDKWGMNMELLTKADTNRTSQTINMKVLGIEDFWGNAWTWTDGIWIDQLGRVCLSTDPDTYNDTGQGYVQHYTGMYFNNTSNSFVGYISGVQGTNELGFWPSKVEDGSNATYFCDGFWQLYSRCLAFGGSWADGANAGPFCLYASTAASDSGSDIGSVLSYL